jgi:divalent metal cation (Fe/Co/Zn/Cd) transporter
MRAERAKDTHAAFMRAILFGTGAAIVGMILYATFAITTGIIVGYVSLAVGWMVGKAMTKGSGGVGGRRYQIAAVLLTYAAVSTAAVPIWMHYASIQQRTKQQKLAQEQQQFEKEFGQTSQRQLEVAAPQKQVPQPSLPAAIMKLLLIGIASPLLEVWEGGPTFGWMIGIVILAVGMKIAWRLTAGKQIEIYGPFNDSAQPAQ